jgi:hypothetical protein
LERISRVSERGKLRKGSGSEVESAEGRGGRKMVREETETEYFPDRFVSDLKSFQILRGLAFSVANSSDLEEEKREERRREERGMK